MGFSDIIKDSFLEGYGTIEIGTKQILVAMGFALAISVYIFFCYRILTRRTFYSKSFNISLVALALITTAVILTIQSSFVVSLGMVGALSIVRFRTAVKEPMDLIFLFWSISVGIICGAGLSEIAIIVSLLITIALFVLDRLPIGHAPKILTVNYDSDDNLDEQVEAVIKKYSRFYSIKSRNVTKEHISMVCELRVKEELALTKELSGIQGVASASLLCHDGEVTF